MRYTRRDFLKGTGIGLVSLAASSCAVFNRSLPKKRPNVILIMADDQGYDLTNLQFRLEPVKSVFFVNN